MNMLLGITVAHLDTQRKRNSRRREVKNHENVESNAGCPWPYHVSGIELRDSYDCCSRTRRNRHSDTEGGRYKLSATSTTQLDGCKRLGQSGNGRYGLRECSGEESTCSPHCFSLLLGECCQSRLAVI